MKRVKVLQNLKIKWMLRILVFMGVAVTVILSVSSLGWVIPNLVESQKQLTTMMTPMENINQQIAFLTNYGSQLMMMSTTDEQKINEIETKIRNVVEDAEKSLNLLNNFMTNQQVDSSRTLEIIRQIKENINALKALFEGENSIFMLRKQGEKDMDKLNNSLKRLTASLIGNLEDIQLLSDKVAQWAREEASRVTNSARSAILMVSVLAVILMVITGIWIERRIIKPINKLIIFADTISQGDLTAEIQQDYNDEVGDLVFKLSDMAHSLNALIGQVQRSGIQVTSSATELSATSKQQEAVMKTQLESTNYVVKSVGEISSVSEELVSTMQRVAAMSDQTAEFASSGQSDLGQMEEAMRHMENASKSISAKLEAINEKAANITSVVTTITKVADQTNLLSLNAAIEAEKAGEYGRGFTVVAREIRRLADQTAVATLDIEQMVQEMQSAVSAGVMEMDAFITEVQRSAENVGKISVQLSRIIEQVQALSPSFEGVNESMQMQAGNAQQINTSMMNLSEEMQQTVESLRESFMAIEQLNDAARGLQEEVSRFKVI
jgi:methyl-accepting chemotaxis protein WspA